MLIIRELVSFMKKLDLDAMIRGFKMGVRFCFLRNMFKDFMLKRKALRK